MWLIYKGGRHILLAFPIHFPSNFLISAQVKMGLISQNGYIFRADSEMVIKKLLATAI